MNTDEQKVVESYFGSQMRAMRLGIASQGWIGTRFVAHSNKRGAGVDCVHLCAEIYKECGLWEDYDFPKYSLDGGAHRQTSQVLEWIEGSKTFQRLHPEVTPKPGDLIVFNFKKVEHHVGLMITGQLFVHVLQHRTVETALIADPTYKRALTHVYRPVEVVR